MFISDLEAKKARVLELFSRADGGEVGTLDAVVACAKTKRKNLLALASRFPTPFYAFDRQALDDALGRFRTAFDAHVPDHTPFYAMKSNPHPWVIARAVDAGFGLDVSSLRELVRALSTPARTIVFSGPAKSEDDLALACSRNDRVTVQIDSFSELLRLGAIAKASGQTVRAGVRVFTDHHGAWSKFGIPLSRLKDFFASARAHPSVALEGIQFHMSWNASPKPYERILADLGTALSSALSPEDRARLRFIDVGGGYKPHRIEGTLPEHDPLGAIVVAADGAAGEQTQFSVPYFIQPSVDVDAYARAIGRAIHEHIRPLVRCATFTEPGRIVSAFSMHLVVRVVDVKDAGVVIVDGGTHMVGWERYLNVYAPVFNLTHPSEREIPVHIGGSLCDPEDVLGARCFASEMAQGDVLVMLFQGAYTYSTAHNFIREIPAVRRLGVD